MFSFILSHIKLTVFNLPTILQSTFYPRIKKDYFPNVTGIAISWYDLPKGIALFRENFLTY